MKIHCIGGGPAGLYFSILMKKAHPETEIVVTERNRPDDTFGWGVVFSDETLGNFEEADPESFAQITASFANWTDIETFTKDGMVRSTGHGFAGLARKKLLMILHARCRELGVELEFERELSSVQEVEPADLVIGCDGLNSMVREAHAEHFEPTIHWGEARFCWLGTTRELGAFTFVFVENEHGVFQVHAYPFEQGLSTWIVECHQDTWKKAGLDQATEKDTVAYCTELFGEWLDGHPLLTNRSMWRSFPTVSCERWSHGHTVLMGDSAHTAHFSIGSGTKLAMEDAIALNEAFRDHGTADVRRVLLAYEDARKIDVLKTQKAAQTSRRWFEETERYVAQPPLQFSFNLMSRSKQITYDNLALRDPELIERVTEWFAEEEGTPRKPDGKALPPMFAPFQLRELELENRICVSPMCQYSAEDGHPNDWHLVHLGSRAVGGAGLLMSEMTNVSAEGRITYGCTGIWSEAHAQSWRRMVDFAHEHSNTKVGLQLGHAGRKGSCNLPWEGDDPLRDGTAWETMAPSALPFDEGWHIPREMDPGDRERVLGQFTRATEFAEQAGFDLVEVHMAHGYLLSSYISPLSNRRRDEYGGSIENRMRFPLEVFDAVRATWPAHKPVAVRISATDWLDDAGGLTIEESLVVAQLLKDHGCDLIDVSSAGNSPLSEPEYGRMYQVPFAERIKAEVEIPVMAVGAILGWDHANTILAAGRADLCALARPHLVDPHLTLRASVAYEHYDQRWPKQYLPAKPKPR